MTARSATCSECPSNPYSPAGSVSIINCICNAGYSGANGGECVACALGLFKEFQGDQECTPCAPGSFTFTPAADSCVVLTSSHVLVK